MLNVIHRALEEWVGPKVFFSKIYGKYFTDVDLIHIILIEELFSLDLNSFTWNFSNIADLTPISPHGEKMVVYAIKINGGVCYKNGVVCYKNGGVCYTNGGVCYKNGGVCYKNGCVCYRNGGECYLVFNIYGKVVEWWNRWVCLMYFLWVVSYQTISSVFAIPNNLNATSLHAYECWHTQISMLWNCCCIEVCTEMALVYLHVCTYIHPFYLNDLI